MKPRRTPPPTLEEIRARAEKLIGGSQSTSASIFTREYVLEILHELEVHQVELEIQNEELRYAVQDMEHSREEYFRLYEEAPVAYLTVNDEGIIVRANRIATALLGMQKGDLTGRGVSNFVDPRDRQIYFGLLQACSERHSPKQGELRLLLRSVGPFHARLEVSPGKNAQGHFDGWRIAFMDISSRIRAEEELKRYTAKLEYSNRELQDFAFIASHDLQEPLRKIRVFGDRLKTTCSASLNETGAGYLDRMCNAAKRLQEMVEGLLEYSRVGMSREPFVRVDLNRTMEEVLSDLRMRIEAVGAEVAVHPLPAVEANPGQIARLFQNLVANSLKFCRGKPCEVRIYGETAMRGGEPVAEGEEGDICRIFVEDTGIGFEQRHAEQIFSLFERLHGRSAYEGTGIGLAVCRRIVERHGGSITAQGVPDEGATFIVTLPVRQEKDAGAE